MLRQTLLVVGGLLLTGCSYYQVSDPTTGRTYYTSDIDRKMGGALAFKDARTGEKVTLQNHEVARIDRDQYDAGKRATITVIPAPVPAGTVITPRGDVDIRVRPDVDPEDRVPSIRVD